MQASALRNCTALSLLLLLAEHLAIRRLVYLLGAFQLLYKAEGLPLATYHLCQVLYAASTIRPCA